MSLTHPPTVGHTSQLKNADISSRSPDRLKPIATRCYFLRLTSIPQSPAPSRPSLPNIPTNTAQHRSPAFPSLPFPSAREGEKEGTSSVVALQARRRAQGDQAAALFSLSPYPASPSPLREFACWRAPWGDAGKCGERLDDVGAVTCNLTVNCNTLTVITLTCSWVILSNSILYFCSSAFPFPIQARASSAPLRHRALLGWAVASFGLFFPPDGDARLSAAVPFICLSYTSFSYTKHSSVSVLRLSRPRKK